MLRTTGWRPEPVMALLVAGLWLALTGLPFLAHAANRLLTGSGIGFFSLLDDGRGLVLAPMFVLSAAPWIRTKPVRAVLAWLAAIAALAALTWLAGDRAASLALASASGRTTFGGGYWLAAALLLLICAKAAVHARYAVKLLAALGAALPLIALAVLGRLDQLSIMIEYANRQDVFDEALGQHLRIVVFTVLPSVAIGLPLGVFAFRRQRLNLAIFPLLNLIQTIPSIALFGLLIAPLAALAAAFPALAGLGVAGIGMAPAVTALILYALLPVARGAAAGLGQVSPAVLEAARGMGLSPRQIFWRVELPLALPIILAGIRTTTIQSIGMATLAALIGAGGFGALMFQGLTGGALDLVLLGVLPVIVLSVLADAVFKSAITLSEYRRP